MIAFNVSNKSGSTFMEKGMNHRPFDLFSFGTQNQFACL